MIANKSLFPIRLLGVALFIGHCFLANAQTVPTEIGKTLYMKGYAACLEANRLRYSNLDLAEQNYQVYLQYKLAIAQKDSSFFQTQDPYLKNNFAYCETVHSYLATARIQKSASDSLKTCFTAQRALDEGALSTAKTLWQVYQRQKRNAQKALLKDPSITHRVEQCDQLGNRINDIEIHQHQFIQLQKNAVNLFNEAQQACLSARVIVQDARFREEDSAVVRYALATSERLAQQGYKLLNSVPDGAMNEDQTKQIRDKVSAQTQCSESVKTRLNHSSNQKDRGTHSLVNLTQELQSALEFCLNARMTRSENPDNFTARQKANQLFDESLRIFSRNQKALQEARTLSGKNDFQRQRIEKLATQYTQCSSTMQAIDTRRAAR